MTKYGFGGNVELSAAAPTSFKPVMINADQRRILEQYLDSSDLNNLGYHKEDFQNDEVLHPDGYYLSLIVKIISHVVDTFGPSNVNPWLHTQFHRLNNQTPLEMMRTHQGALAVEEYLTQVNEGIFV